MFWNFTEKEDMFFVFHVLDSFVELGKIFHFLLIDLNNVHSGFDPCFFGNGLRTHFCNDKALSG